MADISRITLPSGTTYNLKDAEARSQIQALTGGDAVVFIGVSTTKLTDGGSQTPKINNQNVTPSAGQLFFYGTEQFIWGSDGKWHALGSLDSLGSLAYVNSLNSSGSYTPEGDVTFSIQDSSTITAAVTVANSGTTTYKPRGTVSKPTATVNESTGGSTTNAVTIKNPSSRTVTESINVSPPPVTGNANALPAGSTPITYYSVSEETLSLYQLGYTTGQSITTQDVSVKKGDVSYTVDVSQPSFSGTDVRLETGIAVPSTFTATFEGTPKNVYVTGDPNTTIPNTTP